MSLPVARIPKGNEFGVIASRIETFPRRRLMVYWAGTLVASPGTGAESRPRKRR